MLKPKINKSPKERAGHTAHIYDEKLYIFGGFNYDNKLNDLWQFDFRS